MVYHLTSIFLRENTQCIVFHVKIKAFFISFSLTTSASFLSFL